MPIANKLSAKSVRSIGEPGRYGDGNGLYLQVGPTGTKARVFRYKVDGRERFMGFGSVELVSLAEAREKAQEARRALLDGTDPRLPHASPHANRRGYRRGYRRRGTSPSSSARRR